MTPQKFPAFYLDKQTKVFFPQKVRHASIGTLNYKLSAISLIVTFATARDFTVPVLVFSTF